MRKWQEQSVFLILELSLALRRRLLNQRKVSHYTGMIAYSGQHLVSLKRTVISKICLTIMHQI
ncbi:hypothetical protein ZOD2009_19033 [Haladaptatus paucihalophilus DX253]|uniref:Uncharacterized protein n=1 Tax=Haladaptatus paucihalophilus DX253 TaxID=797209 RepID=E7QYB6_HALPU|nr:hypothetical protein ZOD2009_19033 [Haladaptatus paucihalophilus DX253]